MCIRDSPTTPWPYWPLQLTTSSSHKEGCERNWLINTKEFLKDKNGNLKGIKTIGVEWDNSNNVLKFKNTPKLDLKKVNKIPQNTIFNVLDPFTALINTIDNLQLNNSCINKFRIFDGRRRYDLEIIELSRSFLKKDRPKTYEGNVIVCGLRFYPIGGHYLDSKWKPENDKFSDIKLYFGFLNKKFVPVRMEINRWFGSIITRIIFT